MSLTLKIFCLSDVYEMVFYCFNLYLLDYNEVRIFLYAFDNLAFLFIIFAHFSNGSLVFKHAHMCVIVNILALSLGL